MKKVLGTLGVLALMVLILGFVSCGKYNTLQSKDEKCNESWGQVEVTYQRRFDLIPNLVKTVQGYAKHEEGVFTQVAQARSAVGAIDASKLAGDPALQKEFLEKQDQFSSAISRLLMVHEAYPELKADKMFIQLSDELAGTENRIAKARSDFQEHAGVLNQLIRRFPDNIIARLAGIELRPYFTATKDAQQAPSVQF